MLWLALVIFVCAAPGADADGGYLRWTFKGNNAFFPFEAPYAPAILHGSVPGAERIATLNMKDNQWEVTALDIVTGRPVWNALFPATNTTYPGGVVTGSSYLEDPQNLAMVQMGSTIVALDGVTGVPAWQWQVPSNVTVVTISGWGDTVAMLTHGEPVMNPYYAFATTPTVLFAVDAKTGLTRWMLNATQVIPQTQAEQATYAVETFTAGEDFLFYSRASKLAAVRKDGSIVWRTAVSLEGSVGTGQGANITHMVYIPRKYGDDTPVPPRLLINANNWSFQRFILMSLNDTNSSSPATALWRSKTPETAMDDLYYTQPVVDPSANTGKGLFYYWSNRTDWNSGTDVPTWKINLVGRDLSTGGQAWAKEAQPAGGLPSVFQGRLMVVTTEGLTAMQGASGSNVWMIPGKAPPGYSYNIAPTFGNTTGMLVASRCLGAEAPNLCMYSAFEPESAAERASFSATMVTLLLGIIAVLAV